jgi:SAM-dependent methyltransferase
MRAARTAALHSLRFTFLLPLVLLCLPFDRRYFEDPSYAAGLKGGDEVSGYGYYPDYFPIVEAQLSALVELGEARSLLDVGCAKGGLAEYARQHLRVKTIALDFSDYAVSQARRRAGGELTVRATASCLPFAACAFDVCWCNGVLQYLDAEQARSAIRELARVARRASFVSNIAAVERRSDWGLEDDLTRLYLTPRQWEGLARNVGVEAYALPFEGEAAMLLVSSAERLLPLRFLELSLERMQRLGALRRSPPKLEAFRERFR